MSKFELGTEEWIGIEVIFGGTVAALGLVALGWLEDAKGSSDSVFVASAAINCMIRFSDSSKLILEAPAAAFEAEPPYLVWRTVSSDFLADIIVLRK